MSQLFISCKESRIESNRSFYGCFYLGPFEPSQSITIANALRRTLLSELFGLGIVSVEIEGATHEYSSIPGIKDSVLDILLNLKEIVLKKSLKQFKPQIGYLRVRGPGIVRASHLRLPPFIQCVDPNQYIATLSENGFLNMKFIIQYGNKWLSPLNALQLSKETDGKSLENKIEFPKPGTSNSPFNLHLKKRNLILKKLRQLDITSSNFYINLIAQNVFHLSKYQMKKLKRLKTLSRSSLIPLSNLNSIIGQEKYPGINLKNSLKKLKIKKYRVEQKLFKSSGKTKALLRENKKLIFLNSSPLTIDAIFNPINKVNYIIEQNQHRLTPSKIQTSTDFLELYEMLKNGKLLNSNIEEKSSKNFFAVGNQEFENILEINRDLQALKKDITKHNITLEIWTNGSIHPRDALSQGFKNLVKLFAGLKNTKTLHISKNNKTLQTLSSQDSFLNNLSKLENNDKTIIKKVKILTNLPILPLNEKSFLSTYVAPKIKNYYLNDEANNGDTINSVFNAQRTKKLGQAFMIPNKSNFKFIKDSKINKNNIDFNNLDIGFLNLSLHSYTSLKRLKINTVEELINLLNNENEQSEQIVKQLSYKSIKEIECLLKK